MACYSPLKCYPSAERNPETGKHGRTFSGTKSLIEGTLYTLPCGNCRGCRIETAEGWAIRSTHEARVFQFNAGSSFLTLTYSDEHWPADNSVRTEVMQKFMRDLRYRLGSDNPVRYLLCGEYGDLRGRAHYHVLLFGYTFSEDRTVWKTTRDGHKLYTSEVLSLAWPFGRALIGDVSYQSARYVSGYVTKKLNGERAEAAYTRVSPVDGEVYRVEAPFASMSLKPGLGQAWFEKFKGDVFPSDQCIIDGRPHKPPRFYERQLSEEELLPIKRARRAKQAAYQKDATPARLAVRHECKVRQAARFAREVD